jgi:signal transduction histidine kinase
MSSNSSEQSVILNVDDNDGARYAKSRILTRAGFTVIDAASGAEALALARTTHPHLILLDTKLPDINGMEVCRRLKSDAETCVILVLQTSASYLKAADKIRALDGGADNYLFEPIEPEELVANVRALLRLGRVERELREVDRRKDEFLATLAHELRNPLGPIRGALEVLSRLDPLVPPAQEHARQTIKRHTDHMVRLVDDLLDVSRISQGKITLHRELVELRTFLNSAIEISAPMMESRGHLLSTDLPTQEIWLDGDAVRLTQIVGNLLQNAAKFTAPGGSVHLAASRDGGQVRITVADNGIGIPRAKLGYIFGLFAQDRHAGDRVQDGLGIGLSLVKKLVELHGGSVSASSEGEGTGSIFELLLPVAAAGAVPEASQHAQAGAGEGRLGPTRILVVDDNVDAAEMLVALLEMEGHELAVAHNGAEALSVAATFQPRYAFLDIGLPDMSGYELAAAMRALPELADVTLIALTGYGQSEDKARAAQAGFDRHVVKPMDISSLVELGLMH